MTSNPIYDVIEDEVLKILEQGTELPKDFTITLDETEFLALLAGGLLDPKTKLRMPPETTRVHLRIADHLIQVRSENDPDDWESSSPEPQ